MTHSLKNRLQGEFIALYLEHGIMGSTETILIMSEVYHEDNRYKEHVDLCSRILQEFPGVSREYALSEYGRITRLDSKPLVDFIAKYVQEGDHIHGKKFTEAVFDLDDESLQWVWEGSMAEACKAKGERVWDMEFCRDYEVLPDIERICKRLGYTLTLEERVTYPLGIRHESFQGELKKL